MEQTQKYEVQRGLSRMLSSAFTGQINTYADFIKHFGIVEVIKALSPKVRGKVFVTCNGGGDPERASKMNPDIVAMTIESMLLENALVTPDDICKEISTEHMVEVLPHQELYRFLFGKMFSDKTFMQEVLEIILQERMLGENTASNFMKAVGDDNVINESLTPALLLARCQLEMIKLNREGKLFTDEDLLQVYHPKALVQYVVPQHLFAVVEAVAELNAWHEKKGGLPAGALDSEAPPPPAATASQPPPLSKKEKKARRKAEAEAAAASDDPETTLEPGDGIVLEVDEEEEADGSAQASTG